MKTLLIILAVVAVVALIVIKLRKVIKAEKEADEAFAAKYGKFVGQEVWRVSFYDEVLLDDQKNPIADLEGFDCDHFCKATTSEFFPCKITEITRHGSNGSKGRIKTVPLAFEADFEIRYISKTAAILHSDKYGELRIIDDELYEALKKLTSPTVRLKCDPWIPSDEDRPYLDFVEFIIFWRIV